MIDENKLVNISIEKKYYLETPFITVLSGSVIEVPQWDENGNTLPSIRVMLLEPISVEIAPRKTKAEIKRL